MNSSNESVLTPAEAVAYIHAARGASVKVGLDNMRRLCALLGNPQQALRAVHVAGTNGKGSVCACTDAMLRAAGYRVGMYTSPFLQRYAERIRLDGAPIGDEEFMAAFRPVRDAVETLRAQGVRPTVFEIGTALAFLAFAQAGVDVCVIEVGLGGRLDPTNVLMPMVCGVTAIGLDHQAILGDTLGDIAREKAGIFKPGVPVITAAAPAEVTAVFASQAARVGAPWKALTGSEMQPLAAPVSWTGQHCAFDWAGWTLPEVTLRLLGAHQLQNAALALALVAELGRRGFRVPHKAALAGLAAVRWPGRLEYVEAQPPILLDGAHNAQGMQALARFLIARGGHLPKVLLCGMFETKCSPDIFDALASIAPFAVVTALPEQHALPQHALARQLESRGVAVEVQADAASALAAARQYARGGLLVVAGSLYLVGEVRALLCAEGVIGRDDANV